MAHTYATGAAVLVVAILFPILGALTMVLRFTQSRKSKLGLRIDDWLVIPALIFLWAMAGLMIWGAATKSLGYLLPPSPVPGPEGYLFTTSPQQIRLQQIQYHVDWIGVLALGSMKMSILFFYRKIFRAPARDWFDYLTWSFILLVAAWMIAFGFGTIFVCGAEASNAWLPVGQVAVKCSAQLKLLEAYAVSDFVMDCFIWSLPIPKIWSLHMQVRQKVAVAAVFLVGLLTIGASAARMAIYIIYIVNAFAQSDGETLITYLLFWTMIECGLAYLVVNLPTLRSLFGKALPGNALRAIKSAFSLTSLRSREFSEGIRLDSTEQQRHGSSHRHQAHFSDVQGSAMHTSISRNSDLEMAPPKTGIRITREVEHS